jgi:hypothetical protein
MTSCVIISTDYQDDFEGTWYSNQVPLGPLANEVILNIEDSKIDVIVDNYLAKTDYYRTYKDQVIIGWSFKLDGLDILLIDMKLTSEDDLLLRWKPDNMYYPYTSIFRRVER